MPPKRLNPMEEPPAASSSSDEGESDDDDSSSSEEDDAPASPTQKNTPPRASKTLAPASARSQPSQSSDDEDSDDGESETESDPDAPPSVDVKPISTKPMEKVAPKASKSSSKPAPPPAMSPAKRTTAPEQEKRKVKRTKKEDELKETVKKSPYQRLWSDDDEIAILKGMVDFSKMKEGDPLTQIDEFHEFIKKSFQFDFSRAQLFNKIKRLKKKYKDYLENGKRGLRLHELKSFDLSEKLWGNGGLVLGLESTAVSNGKAKKNQNPKVNMKDLTLALKPEPVPSADGNKESMIMENVTEPGPSQCLTNPSLLDEMAAGLGSFEASILKRVKGVIDESKKVELEKKTRKLRIAEIELYLEHKALIGEQANLLLGHYKSLDK